MPTYLIHGFRWSRPMIRIHIAANNLDDCSAEWLVAPVSIHTLLNNFYTNYDFLPPCQQPTNGSSSHSSTNNSSSNISSHHSNASNSTITASGTGKGSVANTRLPKGGHDDGSQLTGFNKWSAVKVLEQYSEKSLVVSQPYAYIGDYILPITLSADIPAEMAAYDQRQIEARQKLERDAEEAAAATSPTNGDSNGNGAGAENGENAEKKRRGPPVSMRSNGAINDIGIASSTNGSGSSNGANNLRPVRRVSVSKLRRLQHQQDWIAQLRDKLQPNAELGWYVVVVDDEERALDEDYQPYEPEYIETWPSKQNSSLAASSQSGDRSASAAGSSSQLGDRSTSGAGSYAVSSTVSSSRPSVDSPHSQSEARKKHLRKRSSVARLKGLFGIQHKEKAEKQRDYEQAAEWEQMRKAQIQNAGGGGWTPDRQTPEIRVNSAAQEVRPETGRRLSKFRRE